MAVAEVSDYVFGNYRGKFVSPPSADLNPKKAFIIFWKDFPFRFVFSHEASYCPWFEFPAARAGVSYQFFEGNLGWAELFNQWGRQERNSFVDILEPGPKRVWVRWRILEWTFYTGQRAYPATEIGPIPTAWSCDGRRIGRCFPTGTRATPEPIELIGLCPVGKLRATCSGKRARENSVMPLAVLDAFSIQAL